MTEETSESQSYLRSAILYLIHKAGPDGMTEEQIQEGVNNLTFEESLVVCQVEDKMLEIEERSDGQKPLAPELIAELNGYVEELINE